MFKRLLKHDSPPPPPPLTENPWRRYKKLIGGWPEKHDQELKEEICKILGEDDINVAFVGIMSSGKSSTINSFFTIMCDRISCRSSAGSGWRSFTKYYVKIPGDPPFEKITFYDTIGIEENIEKGLTTKNAQNMAQGSVEPGTKFDEQSAASSIPPSEELRIHCIVYVLDGEMVLNGLKQAYHDKLTAITEIMTEMHTAPNRIVLLTKMDSVCEEVKKDISKIFHSRKVEETVVKASDITGIPVNSIFPIQNYVSEPEVDNNLNVPLLLALKMIVSFAKDTVTNIHRDDKLCLK